jgi:hypothetical protein
MMSKSPDGRRYICGILYLISFSLGFIELVSSLISEYRLTELSFFFLIMGFVLYYMSSDELGLVNKISTIFKVSRFAVNLSLSLVFACLIVLWAVNKYVL